MPTIHRFYLPSKLPSEGTVTLPSDEAAHAIKVLRLKAGDSLLVMDGLGSVAQATLTPPPGNRRMHDAVCQIHSVTYTAPPKQPIHLYVAPPKGNNMDLLLKEATELGASTITPIFCQYGVARTEKSSKDSWNRNLIAAIKQSSNPWLPKLLPPVSLEEALKTAPGQGFFGAVPSPEDTSLTRQNFPKSGDLSLWIGPEGGFTPEEEQALRDHQLQPLTVGNWILRVETAVPALLACLQFIGRQ